MSESYSSSRAMKQYSSISTCNIPVVQQGKCVVFGYSCVRCAAASGKKATLSLCETNSSSFLACLRQLKCKLSIPHVCTRDMKHNRCHTSAVFFRLDGGGESRPCFLATSHPYEFSPHFFLPVVTPFRQDPFCIQYPAGENSRWLLR